MVQLEGFVLPEWTKFSCVMAAVYVGFKLELLEIIKYYISIGILQ